MSMSGIAIVYLIALKKHSTWQNLVQKSVMMPCALLAVTLIETAGHLRMM